MKIYLSIPLVFILCSTPFSSKLCAEDFIVKDDRGNAVSFGNGTLGLRQNSRNQANQARGSIQGLQELRGLQGLQGLQDLQELKGNRSRVNAERPSRCVSSVKTGTNFNPREHRYSSDVLIQGKHSIMVKSYYFSKSVIIDGDVEHNGTADFVIDEHLIVRGDLLNQGTGNIEIAGDLVITGSLENRGTGDIVVGGTIYKIAGGRLINQGTGDISGTVKAFDTMDSIICE